MQSRYPWQRKETPNLHWYTPKSWSRSFLIPETQIHAEERQWWMLRADTRAEDIRRGGWIDGRRSRPPRRTRHPSRRGPERNRAAAEEREAAAERFGEDEQPSSFSPSSPHHRHFRERPRAELRSFPHASFSVPYKIPQVRRGSAINCTLAIKILPRGNSVHLPICKNSGPMDDNITPRGKAAEEPPAVVRFRSVEKGMLIIWIKAQFY